ncbi:Acyltransferase family protein [Lignipirellula cremea]|uniref:Acyltransferase family protein n=2 Tax=Lignipirellula cremea TaxID=2528010 RepID=A0A518DRW3_9BACT|nr:Acyltransferase family protein [Lignipirellula cremea]
MIVLHHSTYYCADEAFMDRLSQSGPSNLFDAIIWLTTKLWWGVPIFFVISGYCIAASADRHVRKRHSVRSYFARRLQRIYPPLWAYLVIAAILIGVVEWLSPGLADDTNHEIYPPWSLSPGQWLGNLTLTESWRWHFVGEQRYLSGQLWTLCYEEQFYLVVGLLLIACPRYLLLGAAAVTGLTFANLWMFPQVDVDGFFFDCRWFEFAAGIGVYYAINYAGRAGFWSMAALFLGAAVLRQLANYEMINLPDDRLPATIACGYALILLAVHRFDLQIHNAWWTRPLTFCGTMCYSLYLIHWPLVKVLSHLLYETGVQSPALTVCVTLPACLLVSILGGIAFYERVEKRWILSRPSGEPASATTLSSQQQAIPPAVS